MTEPIHRYDSQHEVTLDDEVTIEQSKEETSNRRVESPTVQDESNLKSPIVEMGREIDVRLRRSTRTQRMPNRFIGH